MVEWTKCLRVAKVTLLYGMKMMKFIQTAATKEATNGWIQSAENKWNYILRDGSKVTGWVQSLTSKLWYYMNNNGDMLSNTWINDTGTWYYLKANGSMPHNEYIDGYYVDINCRCIQ